MVAMWPLVTLVLVAISLQTTVAEGDCVADICFVLDESGSIGITNWGKIQTFVKAFVDLLTIGDSDSRVGVVKFSHDAGLDIQLDAHDNKADLKAAIDALSYDDGGTDIGKAIKTAREECFSSANGDRPNGPFPNMMIVITDGDTINEADAIMQADLARQEGITLIVIGIGSFIDLPNLEDIAGNIDENLFQFADFDDFVDDVHDVFLQHCAAIEVCVADICFVLDESGSIGAANWVKVQTFAKAFVDMLTIGDTDSRVGVVKFSHNSELTFKLDANDNNNDVKAAIDALSYARGGTNIGKGIKTAREECFSSANGDRLNGPFPNIMIVMTDGFTNNDTDAILQADLARLEGTTVIVIGIGNGIDEDNLKDIAGNIDENFFDFADFDAFVASVYDVFLQHCAGARVFCTAEFEGHDLWNFDSTPFTLPDDKILLIEYNPGDGDVGCKFRAAWDRRLQPFEKRWMMISVGVHPNKTNKYFRGIDFEQKPDVVADEPTQRGWRCKPKITNSICVNPPFIPSDSFMIGMPPNPPANPYASVTKPDAGPTPLSYKVELVDGDIWCPGEDNNPKYSMTYYFTPMMGGAKMLFSLDRAFYAKHWSELSGLCVGADPNIGT